MSMANAFGVEEHFVTLNGVRYPMVVGPGGQATPIATAPQAAFPEALILGDASRSSDQRMAQVALGDWRGGAGTFRYPAGQGGDTTTTFAVSDGDTRYERSLVCRRQPTARSITNGFLAVGQRNVYTGYAGATEMTHPLGGTLAYWTGAAYVAAQTTAGPYIGTLSNCYAVVRCGKYTFAASNNIIAYTTNGTTWTSVAAPSIAPGALLKHDNKLWALIIGTNTATLYQSADAPTNAPGMTWTAGATIPIDANETAVQLVEWRNRYGQRAIYALTTRYLYGYDEDSQSWQQFFDFSRFGPLYTYQAFAYVWPRDDNLYLCCGTDGVFQFSGTQVDFLTPNLGGGLPLGQRANPIVLDGNSRYLYAWGYRSVTDLASATGAVWCVNQQGGWHRLYRDMVASPPGAVAGGGWCNGQLVSYTVGGAGGDQAVSQVEPDISDLPVNASNTAYFYDTAVTQSHYTALIDGGMPNIPIRPLYVEVRAIKQSDGRSQGLATNTTAAVYIRTNVNTGWVQLGGTLTSASTFPARLPINSGLGSLVSDIDIRIDLATTSAAVTPIVTDVILHYARMPQVRSEYTLQLDLRETNPAFKQDATHLPGTFFGKTAHDLKALLYDLSGLSATNNYRAQVVPFSYGGGPHGNGSNAISLGAAMVRVASNEDSLNGDGIFRVAILDLTTPASGT